MLLAGFAWEARSGAPAPIDSPNPQVLALSGDLSVHDPSIIRTGDTYYLFSTAGGTVVIEPTTPNWRGPGHQAVLRDLEEDYPAFHAHRGVTGRSELKISTMIWEDGWPRVGALP